MLDEVMPLAEEKMAKSLSFLQKELQAIRAGRATPTFLEKVVVPYYDSSLPLNQIATISAPDPRTLLIQPWDQSISKEVERAILKANLGVTPRLDGQIIRVVFPPLTEERRIELVKLAKKLGEDCRVELRNHRRSANEEIKGLKEANRISEDERDRYIEKVQKLLEKYSSQVDELIERKEKQIMEV